MLQYYINIIANTQQLLDIKKIVWNLSKLNSRHINVYCKNLTQAEVEYGLNMLAVK